MKFRPPSLLKVRDFLQVDPPKAARPHGTSPFQRPVAASPCHLHDRDQDALRRAASRAPERLRAEPRQPVRFASGKLECSAGAFFAFDTTFGHSKDGNKHAARKAGRCASARGAPSQRGAGPLGAGGQHLNSHSRQSVAGAAACTLREAGWAQECAFHPGQAVVGGHDRFPARSGLRSPTRPLPRANGLCCWGHPGLEVRRPQSAIRAAAGRSRHPFDPRRCGATAAQAGSLASAFGSAGAVGALDLQRIRTGTRSPNYWPPAAHGVGRLPLCRRAAHVPRVVASRQARPAERVLADQSLRIWPAIRRPWSTSMRSVFNRLQTFLSTAKSFFRLHTDLPHVREKGTL